MLTLFYLLTAFLKSVDPALSNDCGVFWWKIDPASMGRRWSASAFDGSRFDPGLMNLGSLGPDGGKCFPALSRDVWEERGLAPIAGSSSLRFATGNWTRDRTHIGSHSTVTDDPEPSLSSEPSESGFTYPSTPQPTRRLVLFLLFLFLFLPLPLPYSLTLPSSD